jgi:hypothetical protein
MRVLRCRVMLCRLTFTTLRYSNCPPLHTLTASAVCRVLGTNSLCATRLRSLKTSASGKVEAPMAIALCSTAVFEGGSEFLVHVLLHLCDCTIINDSPLG